MSQDDPMICYPLTPDRWRDFEALFGAKGAYGGCWCMWWRLSRREFERQQGEKNRLAMKTIVDSGTVPGILGYQGGAPVGWCSVAPRDQFPSLNRSRILRSTDDLPVWSIVCFFIERSCRGSGVSHQLIGGAVDYVRACGGSIVEAYPTVVKSASAPPVSSYQGFPGMFERAGFRQHASPSPSKRVMRLRLDS